jgi:hypothetical protein
MNESKPRGWRIKSPKRERENFGVREFGVHGDIRLGS